MDRDDAEALLKQSIGNSDAQFRDGQWDAIDGLVNQSKKLLEPINKRSLLKLMKLAR